MFKSDEDKLVVRVLLEETMKQRIEVNCFDWMESEFIGRGILGRCLRCYEKGHGSAVDIIRRNLVRQISESEEGMLDIDF